AIDVAAEYGAAVAVPPSAKAELLRQAVTSADWPTLAGTMLSRAHAMFAQCLGLQHASIACVTKLRGLLHAHLGAHAAAVECFRAVIALCESEDVEVDEQSTAGVKYNLGVCLMACGDYAGAVSSFTSVRDVYARCRGEWHPSVTAVTAKLAQAQRAGMESQYTHLYSAALGAYADKRYKDAHDAFIAALALLPNDAQTAYHVATCCVHVGCCEGGVDWFSRAVEWGYADIASVLSDPDMAHLCTDVRFLRLLSRANAEDEESDVDVD
ncbi:MAG: hypothetical protein P4L40_11330, partial [Terracidiphilus sp.]|nr:hypothetical protein [Terracidiphilus sp.]